MKRLQIATFTAVFALLLAAGAGVVLGSWTTSKLGKGVPALMTTQVSDGTSKASFAEGFAPVADRAIPAVVNVSSSKVIRTPGGNAPSPFFSDPFFQEFFGGNLPKNYEIPPSASREQSLGSGVVVNADGYILTNNHVVNGAKDVKVLLQDKREFQARIVGTDAKTDLAVLKVDAKNLPVLNFGDSTQMQVGNFVLAIGNPFGLNQTVTLGIVSATGRGGLGIEDYEDFIQTDAAINPGNSGGALIDAQGSLIGINTAIVSEGGGNQGVGFAIPGNMAHKVMEEILKHGKVSRAWLGVSIQPVTQDIAKFFHLPDTAGALIAGVTKDSPAEKAGIETGDIVVDVDGQKIGDSRDLQLKIGSMPPDSTVKLTVFRNGGTKDLSVKLAEMPAGVAAEGGPGGSNPAAKLRGISVEDLTPGILRQLKLPAVTRGVVVTGVDPASPAADAGLQEGDVIQQVNRQDVTSAGGFARAMQSAGDQSALLLVNRNGSTTFKIVQPK